MKKHALIHTAIAVAVLAFGAKTADAHCQVPCGIFADQLRFEAMLEDQSTIAKAGVQLGELIEKGDALRVNQATRWIVVKEEHCQKIQDTIAKYFMAQRIKPGDDAAAYQKTLVAAHNVMRAAMKAKQDPSAEVAEALKTSIFDLYRAYEGKEPDFAHSH